MYQLPICRIYTGRVSWHTFLFVSSAQHVSSPLSKTITRGALLMCFSDIAGLFVSPGTVVFINFILFLKTSCRFMVSMLWSLDFVSQNWMGPMIIQYIESAF